MISERNDEGLAEVHVDVYDAIAQKGLSVSTSRKGLLSDEKPITDTPKGKLPIVPSRLRLPRCSFGRQLVSPSAKIQQIAVEKDEISRSVPSFTSQGFGERLNGILARKIDWNSLWNMCKQWIKNPLNMVLFLWIICVAVSGAILFLVMTGMLNNVLPNKSQKDAWFEVEAEGHLQTPENIL
ncbi:hypothetical protein SLE2022_073370 [Rubroshorea leprosula]